MSVQWNQYCVNCVCVCVCVCLCVSVCVCVCVCVCFVMSVQWNQYCVKRVCVCVCLWLSCWCMCVLQKNCLCVFSLWLSYLCMCTRALVSRHDGRLPTLSQPELLGVLTPLVLHLERIPFLSEVVCLAYVVVITISFPVQKGSVTVHEKYTYVSAWLCKGGCRVGNARKLKRTESACDCVSQTWPAYLIRWLDTRTDRSRARQITARLLASTWACVRFYRRLP